jgi:hypothetical protein
MIGSGLIGFMDWQDKYGQDSRDLWIDRINAEQDLWINALT